MSKLAFAWSMLAIYGVISAVLAYRGYRKTRSMEGFVVGNRDMSPFLVGLALAAQLTSVATFVVNPGLIYAYGLPALLGMGLAACLGITIGVTVLSKGFRAIGEKLSAVTVPGWLGSRYQSRGMQIGFALLSLGLITFIVLIVVAMAYVLMKMLDIPVWAALGGVVVLVFAYVLLGGANASVYSNSVQSMIMVAVGIVLIGSGLHLFADGIGPFFERLEAIDAGLVGLVNPKSLYFRNLFEVFVCNFLVGLAIVCQPHVMGKALSLKSDRDVNKYLVTAVGVGMIFMMVMLTGLYGRLVLPPIARMDLVIPTYIDTQFSPITGVIISIGVLFAGLSTLEGLLLALTGIMATDLYMPLLGNRMKDSTPQERGLAALKLARLSLVVIGVACFVLGLYQVRNPTGGSVAIFAQYGIYCLFSASFGPMLFGMFFQAVPRLVAAASAIVAVSVYVGTSVLQITSMHNNPAFLSACAIIASIAILTFGTLRQHLALRSARRRVEAYGRKQPA